MRISRVAVYGDAAVPEVSAGALASFLRGCTGAPAAPSGGIFEGMTAAQAAALASCRVGSTARPFRRRRPDPREIDEEISGGIRAGAAGRAPGAACYDGFEMQRAVAGMIPRAEAERDVLHIVITGRLTCTYEDEGDMRYHGRALIGSNPALISAPGMVEAPARPRQYYVDLIGAAALGGDAGRAAERYAGRYLERGDPRMAAAAEGYALQAVAYYATGEAFCGDRDCRLYNAHWQEELLRAQVESGRLCGRHAAALRRAGAG